MDLLLKNVSAGYGNNTVLKDINLSIREGETVFIGGRNGTGKTTLLRVMSGLMAFEGGVTVGGDDISKMKRRNVARLIALMPQAAEMYFQYTCYQTVLLGRFARSKSAFGSFTEEDREAAKAAMETCGVYEYRDRLLNELSGDSSSESCLPGHLHRGPRSCSLMSLEAILMSNTVRNFATIFASGRKGRHPLLTEKLRIPLSQSFMTLFRQGASAAERSF